MRRDLTIDELCADLRRQIVERAVQPGAKLSESVLCRRWKVSRTPVREALRRLEAEGLISSVRYKGFIVTPVTLEDIDQLYPIKICLEVLAGGLAAPFLTRDPQKIESLKALCRNMEGAAGRGDIADYALRNRDFHFSIWRACQNPWLIKMLEGLDSQIQRFIVKALQVPGRMERSVTEHRDILQKLKTGNRQGVEKAIGKHFRQALEEIKRELVKTR